MSGVKEISEGDAQHFAQEAKTMWKRALVIVGNETKREVALAVITAHLAEYRNVPQEFLVGVVFEGLVQASRVADQIKCEKGIDASQITERAMLARDLLIESEILKPTDGY